MENLNIQQLSAVLGGFIQHAKINFDASSLDDYDRNITAIAAVAAIAAGTARTMPETRQTRCALSVFGAIAEIAPELNTESDPESEQVWETLDTWDDSLRGLYHLTP